MLDEKLSEDELLETDSASDIQNEDFDDEQDAAKALIHGNAKTYKSSETQYSDYFSSAVILLIFGILGTIFVIINIAGVLSIFNSLFQYIVGLVMFIGFLIGSIFCFKTSKQYKSQIANENQQHDTIKSFLNDTVSDELLQSFDNEGESKESNYLSRVAGLKELVLKEYSDADEDFVESLIEEFYNDNY